jgi:hypothetical protein
VIVMTAKDVLRSKVIAQVLNGKLSHASARLALGSQHPAITRLERQFWMKKGC